MSEENNQTPTNAEEESTPSPNTEEKDDHSTTGAIDFTIRVYISSVSLDRKLKTEQQKIMAILDAKKIPYETVDVANNKVVLRRMRQMCGNPSALPPQVFKGNKYMGNFNAFEEATDDKELEKFLML